MLDLHNWHGPMMEFTLADDGTPVYIRAFDVIAVLGGFDEDQKPVTAIRTNTSIYKVKESIAKVGSRIFSAEEALLRMAKS